jgi:hypothetical protein
MCRWNDNAVVTLALNHQMHLSMGTAKRYSQHNKKRTDVPEPSIIHSYNKGTGGVDVLDRPSFEVRSGGGIFLPVF